MCTHLHVDHVGWNTKLENGRWVPTFPKAKYVFADRELAYWTETEKADPSAAPWVTDFSSPSSQRSARRWSRATTSSAKSSSSCQHPGHTIDHYSVQVGKPAKDAVITGDMIHSPLQARYPELGMRVDYSSAPGRRITPPAVQLPMRHIHFDLHGALPVTVLRSDETLGRRLQVRGSGVSAASRCLVAGAVLLRMISSASSCGGLSVVPVSR